MMVWQAGTRCLLLSGFTEKKPKEINAVSPVAHRGSFEMIKKEVDNILVLHVSDLPCFAVASFYDKFPDMSDEEVISYLSRVWQRELLPFIQR